MGRQHDAQLITNCHCDALPGTFFLQGCFKNPSNLIKPDLLWLVISVQLLSAGSKIFPTRSAMRRDVLAKALSASGRVMQGFTLTHGI